MTSAKRILCLALAVLFTFFAVPLSFASYDDEPEKEHRYLAFASDLHGQTDTAVSALTGFPEDTEYVSFIGDMVGEGANDAPAYNSSNVFGPVYELFEEIMAKYFSIIWADHDKNVTDDAQVVYCKDGKGSGELFDMPVPGRPSAYYLYAVSFDDMTSGGESSYDAAAIFKRWVKKKDPSIPIIVLSHVPVQSKRGDNPGAIYWNEALNYAATGVEGIVSLDDSHQIIRNVIFLCGHNHTVDRNEYVFKAGTQMTVQIDTTIPDGPYSFQGLTGSGCQVITEENDDEEYTALSLGKAKADGVVSSIYYTSIVPGYIKTSGSATLMDISKDSISFTKKNAEGNVDLGVDGVTNEAVESLTIARIMQSDEGGPVIKTQPQDVFVNYPEGASFTVEAEDPDSIASYQWYALDKEDTLFVLEGTSADSPELVIPSTVRANDVLRFYCVLTDKNGLKTVTRQAALENENRHEYKPVFYVGEYAIEPGESIDLATVDIGDGHKLGEGTVTFDSNATDITFKNVKYDNKYCTADFSIAHNVGLGIEFTMPDKDEYNFIFEGDNFIDNYYFDSDYNAAGIPFDLCFDGDEGEKPLVNFIGDGTLTVSSGMTAIRVIGDLMIDIDITIGQKNTNYGDGIDANSILVAEGVNVNMIVNGYAFLARNNLFMKSADVNITTNTPSISKGVVTKNILTAGNTMSIEDTSLCITSLTDQSVCASAAGGGFINAYNELFISNGSNVKCVQTVTGTDVFNNEFTGFSSTNTEIDDSQVSIEVDSDKLSGCIGLYSEENTQVTDSTLDVKLKSVGTTYGIIAGIDFNADESDVSVDVSCHPGGDPTSSMGLVCENAVFRLADKNLAVTFRSADGPALVCDLKEPLSDTPYEYEEGHKMSNIYLRDNTVISVPEDCEANITNVTTGSAPYIKYAKLETIYDKNDLSAPASVVIVSAPEEAPSDEETPANIIKGNPESKEVTYGYRTTVTFTAEVPDRGSVQWYLNDEPAGTDSTLIVEEGREEYTVRAVVTARDGSKTADEEKVTIKNGFFDKIIWFFKYIFSRKSLTVIQ